MPENLSRRHLLQAAGAAALGVVVESSVVNAISSRPERNPIKPTDVHESGDTEWVETIVRKEWPLGKYVGAKEILDKNGYAIDYVVYISDVPIVEPARFSAAHSLDPNLIRKYPSGDFNDGKIPLRNSTRVPDITLEAGTGWAEDPAYEGIEGWNGKGFHRILLDPSEIKATHMVAVFGDVINLLDYTGELNSQDVLNTDGQILRGGVWYALANEGGDYVRPDGSPILNNGKPVFGLKENPYFVSQFFIG